MANQKDHYDPFSISMDLSYLASTGNPDDPWVKWAKEMALNLWVRAYRGKNK